MKITTLKTGQEVWIHNGEFPVKEKVDVIDLKSNEVWLSDGNPYNPSEIYSTEYNCKKNN